MAEGLDILESRLEQLLERWHALREENLRLRQQVVVLENGNKQLNDRLNEARGRMETLYNQIPD